MFSSARIIRTLSLAGLASTLALAAMSSVGCSVASEDSVSPTVQVVDKTRQALSAGALKFVNGTYSTCTSRTGNWSARISGTDISDPMPYAPVSVVKNDAACRLVVTALKADATYAGNPSITMVTSYAGTASSFAAGSDPIAFYGNAKLSALTYAAGFTMTILFSDNLADATDSTAASFASVSSTASESQVVAPDYTLDFGALALQTDALQVVQSASGSIAPSATNQTGERFVVSSNGSLGSTFAAVDAEFLDGTPQALEATIPASDLGLNGAELPAVRSLIIAHTVSGVTAYQVIRITFNAAQ
jgi:hypothetical protein